MNVNSPEEREIAKNCVAFCGALRRVEQQLRSEENSDAIIDGVLQAAAEFYGASRASIVEADWELGVGIITHEWCADGVEHQKDMLQYLAMEMFPNWKEALRTNQTVITANMHDLDGTFPDEADFFRNYGVGRILAAPFSKRINQGFPQDFHGRSLSVSDVIAVRQNGVLSAHYVDSIGFVELPGFFADVSPARQKISIQEQLKTASNVLKNRPDNKKTMSIRRSEAR